MGPYVGGSVGCHRDALEGVAEEECSFTAAPNV